MIAYIDENLLSKIEWKIIDLELIFLPKKLNDNWRTVMKIKSIASWCKIDQLLMVRLDIIIYLQENVLEDMKVFKVVDVFCLT